MYRFYGAIMDSRIGFASQLDSLRRDWTSRVTAGLLASSGSAYLTTLLLQYHCLYCMYFLCVFSTFGCYLPLTYPRYLQPTYLLSTVHVPVTYPSVPVIYSPRNCYLVQRVKLPPPSPTLGITRTTRARETTGA